MIQLLAQQRLHGQQLGRNFLLGLLLGINASHDKCQCTFNVARRITGETADGHDATFLFELPSHGPRMAYKRPSVGGLIPDTHDVEKHALHFIKAAPIVCKI